MRLQDTLNIRTTIGGTMGTPSYQRVIGKVEVYSYKNVRIEKNIYFEGGVDYTVIGLFKDMIPMTEEQFNLEFVDSLIESDRVTRIAIMEQTDTTVVKNYMEKYKEEFVGLMAVYMNNGESKAVAFAKSWSCLNLPVSQNIMHQIGNVMMRYGYEFTTDNAIYKLIK